MTLQTFLLLAVVTGVLGSTNTTVIAGPDPTTSRVPPQDNTVTSGQVVGEAAEEDVMATGELNVNHYPANRAAKVVQHYLNIRYGSPCRLFGLQRVHRGNAEQTEESGRKYQLEISVQELISNSTAKCSAEVLFARDGQSPPDVQTSSCEDISKINTTAQEEALYQQYRANNSLISAESLPDSYGHMDPDMKPLWRLGSVASSFVMLEESTEDTLYNMAQVANVTQLETENDQLKFNYHVLLHDMVSQEILHWKLLVTWSPAGGVNVLQREQMPKCHECEEPPNAI